MRPGRTLSELTSSRNHSSDASVHKYTRLDPCRCVCSGSV